MHDDVESNGGDIDSGGSNGFAATMVEFMVVAAMLAKFMMVAVTQMDSLKILYIEFFSFSSCLSCICRFYSNLCFSYFPKSSLKSSFSLVPMWFPSWP